MRELISGGATFIKVIATGAVLAAGTTPGAAEYSEAEIHAAVDEAAQYGIFVAAHAHGAEGIKRAVRAGVRSIEHGSYLDDEGIALMKKHGTWLVADIYNGDYIAEVGRRDQWSEEILRKNDETTQTQRDGFAKAAKAGVRIAFGTDSGVYPHGDNARQFAYMVRYGLTPMDAIRAATLNSAQLLAKEKDLGSITAGKFADLIAVEGDPLSGHRQASPGPRRHQSGPSDPTGLSHERLPVASPSDGFLDVPGAGDRQRGRLRCLSITGVAGAVRSQQHLRLAHHCRRSGRLGGGVCPARRKLFPKAGGPVCLCARCLRRPGGISHGVGLLDRAWVGNAAIAIATVAYLAELIPWIKHTTGAPALASCVIIWVLT